MESAGPGPASPGSISILDAIVSAARWTKGVLFQPFRIENWLIIGFCAWLANLGHGGNGGSSGWRGSRDGLRSDAYEAGEWVLANLPFVIIVVCFLFVFLTALIILITWLSSRGKFMFLENVIHRRGAVVEPWKRFRRAADSVFLFRIALGLLALVFFMMYAAAVILLVLLMGWDGNDLGPPAAAFLILAILFAVAVGFALGLVGLALNDFVVPIVYLRDRGVIDGWRVFGSLLGANLVSFILYLVARIVIFVFVVAITLLAVCCTCCLVVIPYVGTVLLLPIHVFVRSYSIFFLGQFGPELTLVPAAAGPEGGTAGSHVPGGP